jgi:chromosome segregation ATPase
MYQKVVNDNVLRDMALVIGNLPRSPMAPPLLSAKPKNDRKKPKSSPGRCFTAPTTMKRNPRESISAASMSAHLQSQLPKEDFAESKIATMNIEAISRLMERRQQIRQQELLCGDSNATNEPIWGSSSQERVEGENKKTKEKFKSTSLPPLQQSLGFSISSAFSDDNMATNKVDGDDNVHHAHVAVESWLNSVVSASAPETFTSEEPSFYATEAYLHSKISHEPYENVGGVDQHATPDLAKIGMDRASLLRVGLTKKQIDRLFRALYVYSVGFHGIIREVSCHAPQMLNVSSKIWRTYVYLLQECSEGKENFQMAVSQMNEENRQLISQAKAECQAKVSIAHEEASSLKREIETLSQNLTDAKNLISDYEKMLYQEGEEAKDLRKAVETAKADARLALVQKNQATHYQQEAQREAMMTSNALTEIMRELQVKTSLLRNATEKIKMLDEQKDNLIKKNISLEKTCISKHQQILEMTSHLDNAESRQKAVMEDMERMEISLEENRREIQSLTSMLVVAHSSISQRDEMLNSAREKENVMEQILANATLQIEDEKKNTQKFVNLQSQTFQELEEQKDLNEKQNKTVDELKLEISSLKLDKLQLFQNLQENKKNILLMEEQVKGAQRKAAGDQFLLEKEKEKTLELLDRFSREKKQWASSEDSQKMLNNQIKKMQETMKVLEIKLSTMEGQKKKAVETNEESRDTIRTFKKEIRELTSSHSKAIDKLTIEHAAELEFSISSHESTKLQLNQLHSQNQDLLESSKVATRNIKDLEHQASSLEQELMQVTEEAHASREKLDARWEEEVRKLEDEKLAHKFTKMKVKRVCALVDSTEEGLRNFANGAVKLNGKKNRRKIKASENSSDKFIDKETDELNNAVDNATAALDEIEQITKSVVLRLAQQQRNSMSVGRLSNIGSKRVIALASGEITETEAHQQEDLISSPMMTVTETINENFEPSSPLAVTSYTTSALPASPLAATMEDVVYDAIRLKELETTVRDLKGQVQSLEMDKEDLEKEIECMKARVNGAEREYEFNINEMKKEFGVFQSQRNQQAEQDCLVEKELRLAAESKSIEVSARVDESEAKCEGLIKDLDRLNKTHSWTGKQLEELKKEMLRLQEEAQKNFLELSAIKETRSSAVTIVTQTDTHITGLGSCITQSPHLPMPKGKYLNLVLNPFSFLL